jgi:vancomycin resistance protein VanW
MSLHRWRRRWEWLRSDANWARSRADETLPELLIGHRSILLRELAPDVMWMQHNKVTNLGLATGRTDRLLIAPGETFSFNRTVGNATKRKGYVDGMRLSQGEAVSGVGGGICQLANLLHWMFLHSDLTVTERSEHSFDPFPDNERVLPWGVGCSIVYNYVDLVVRNDTDLTFELRTWLDDEHLLGELRASSRPEHHFRVYAVNERFATYNGETFRQNEIWRDLLDEYDTVVGRERVRENCARVKYAVTDDS